ncbi:uncharacterized protein L203_105305 [Cryptococcus depauperatus CBS 7841]|uniref:Uncharacterized protein n=1 Tax=Cryptococcus depauperatus CBS 7841 TaxID=1295531 RepID=A0AAJ8M2D6_9TREE
MSDANAVSRVSASFKTFSTFFWSILPLKRTSLSVLQLVPTSVRTPWANAIFVLNNASFAAVSPSEDCCVESL